MTHIEAMKLALEALEKALDAIESWGSYASEYFQVKHDWKGDIENTKASITALRQAIEQSTEQDRHVLQAKGEHPAPCARFCEADAFQIEIRNLKKRFEQSTEVGWGVDWGKAGDIPIASIIKRLPDGEIEVVAVEFAPYSYTSPPQPQEAAPTEQEPVAWMHTQLSGNVIPHRPADLDRHPDRWEALYKTPPPCPTCEALARTVMMDQTAHDTTPPQRQWVGLTDEEIQECFKITPDQYLPLHIYARIEAKLRSKNEH